MATTKKSIMAPKPSSAPLTVEDFVAGAAHQISDSAGNSGAKKEKEKKTQVPLLILPSLLEALDAHLEEQGTGISRSAWICQAIKKQMEAQG